MYCLIQPQPSETRADEERQDSEVRQKLGEKRYALSQFCRKWPRGREVRDWVGEQNEDRGEEEQDRREGELYRQRKREEGCLCLA